jgi:G3E family GTPase
MIHDINSTAPVYHTVKGEIDLNHIIGIQAYKTGPSVGSLPPLRHDHTEDDHHGAERPHYELRGIASMWVPCPVLTSSQMEKLDEWIRTVLWENRLPSVSQTGAAPLYILRCKGILTTHDGEQYLLQGVRDMYEMTQIEVPQTAGGEGKLVFIGRGLTEDVRDSLQEVFRA